GSGIVGKVMGDGNVLIDFEGAIHGQEMSYEDRVHHAWGRHTWNDGRGYPTIARMVVPFKDLIEVGFLEIREPTDEEVADELRARYGIETPNYPPLSLITQTP